MTRQSRFVTLLAAALAAVACDGAPPAGAVASASGAADSAGGSADAGADSGGVAAASCTDGIVNGTETAKDCGGSCSPCAVGSACKVPADCATALCATGSCVSPGYLLGTAATATLTPVLTSNLKQPTALGFHPTEPDQLWVASFEDGALTVAHGVTSGTATKVQRYRDEQMHFLEKVVSLSFSDNKTFGTCGDTRNDYNGKAPANDFMGPVQWPAALKDFQTYGPDASKVHLDMMHDTPRCMGIAAAGGNSYFVFNGLSGNIDLYDFGLPHPHGADDHSDGSKRRYLGLGLKRVAGVPGHLAYDAKTETLYIADTGNSRVLRMDTKAGSFVKDVKLYPVEVKMEVWKTTSFAEVASGFDQPSGLLLHEGTLYMGDAGTGRLYAFSPAGDFFGSVETGLPKGALAGLAAGPDAKLYVADRKGNRVLRVER